MTDPNAQNRPKVQECLQQISSLMQTANGRPTDKVKMKGDPLLAKKFKSHQDKILDSF